MAIAGLVVFLAAATPTIAPTDVSELLAAAPGNDWLARQPSADNLVGVITAHSYTMWTQDDGASERALNRKGFVTGYGREWVQKVTQDGLLEFVLEFNTDGGASSWYDGVKIFDQTSKYYKKDIPALPSGQSVGVQWTFSDGSREFAIEFTKGNLFFDVTMDADTNDLAAATLAQAQSEFELAPAEAQLPASATTPVPGGALILASVFLIVVTFLGILGLARWSRRRPPAVFVPAALQMSPDGRWWWDGTRWRSTAGDPPPGLRPPGT